MAKLVFGLNQSLDGYVDHLEFAPGPAASQPQLVSDDRRRGHAFSVFGLIYTIAERVALA